VNARNLFRPVPPPAAPGPEPAPESWDIRLRTTAEPRPEWWDIRRRARGERTRRRTLVVGAKPNGGLDGRVGPVRLADGLRPDLADHLCAHAPDEVYFDLGSEIADDVVAGVGARLLMEGIAVHLVLPAHHAPPVDAVVARVGSHAVISLRAVRDGVAARAIRRLMDLAVALGLLVALAPVMVVVALAIVVSMGRPVLHAHARLGLGGRVFPCLKFRSMVRDAERRLRDDHALYRRYVEANFKMPDDEDPRVTRLGRLLRRTSLDELPQLWNVLVGHMTLVGPRPIVPAELERYGEYGRLLLRVKPGLTGLWQVSGRSSIGYPERARLDLEYLATRSFTRDLQLILRTVPAVIRQRGAI
jgi:exopolysaccharide production protein ExoY